MGTPIRRRTRDSSWQWLMIGMALGVGCSLVVCLAGYVIGLIGLGDALEDSEPEAGSNVVIVTQQQITATPPPASPTPAATEEEIATEESTQEPAETQTPIPGLVTVTPTSLPGSGIITITPAPGTGTTVPATTASNTTAGITAATTTANEVATEFPVNGATITPSIGSSPGVPEALAGIITAVAQVTGGTYTMGTTNEEATIATENCVIRDLGTCTIEDFTDAIPAHQVTVNDFYMEIYEVSTTQYAAFLNYLLSQNPNTRVDRIGCGGQPCILTQEDDPQSYIQFDGTQYVVANASFYGTHPVTYVTWWGANEYCRAIGRRLPTEAEWERAARGPANSIFPWGADWLPELANTSRPTPPDGTSPVDSYPLGTSEYGMYNMSGNVGEWVSDFYLPTYYAQPDASGDNPKGPITSSQKVIRGGGWDNVPSYTRAVHRLSAEPNAPRGSVGFRCVSDRP